MKRLYYYSSRLSYTYTTQHAHALPMCVFKSAERQRQRERERERNIITEINMEKKEVVHYVYLYVCRADDDDHRVLNFDNRVHFLPLCPCHRHCNRLVYTYIILYFFIYLHTHTSISVQDSRPCADIVDDDRWIWTTSTSPPAQGPRVWIHN